MKLDVGKKERPTHLAVPARKSPVERVGAGAAARVARGRAEAVPAADADVSRRPTDRLAAAMKQATIGPFKTKEALFDALEANEG